MGELDGRVALVTGGARGQGAAEARIFAAAGATVVITDVLDEAGEQTAGDIGCTYLHLDVTSEEGWAAVVADTVSRHGRLDVLMNNAGIFQPARLIATTTDMWNRTVAINQTGVFFGMRAAVPAMIDAGNGGSIINTSSIAGLEGGFGATAYASDSGDQITVWVPTESIRRHIAAQFDINIDHALVALGRANTHVRLVVSGDDEEEEDEE